MRTARRGTPALALAFLVLFAVGCSVESLKIQLSSFGEGNVDGIWLWRLQPSGVYARECRFQISNPYQENGTEVIYYDEICNNGANGPRLEAQVQRPATDSEAATLMLIFQPIDSTPGTYRATAYNASGESAMSSTFVRL